MADSLEHYSIVKNPTLRNCVTMVANSMSELSLFFEAFLDLEEGVKRATRLMKGQKTAKKKGED